MGRGIRATLGLLAAVVVIATAISAVLVRPSTGHTTTRSASAGGSHSSASASAAAAHGEVPAADSQATSVYGKVSAASLKVLKAKGPEAALAYLDKRIHDDPAVSGICHAVAHDLGHAALDLYKGDASKALGVRNDVCGGGYTHGIVEKALGDSTNIERDLLAVCAPEQDGSCWHGVGHGVMFATKYDLPRTLSLCDTAPSDNLSARCGEGVFMQQFTLDDGIGHAAGSGFTLPTPKTAAKICAGAYEPYNDICWFYSVTVWLQEHPDDWKGAISWCRSSAGEFGGRLPCLRGMGSRMVKYHPDTITANARVCDSLDGEEVDMCLSGMGSYWSVHWKGLRERIDVCRHIDDDGIASRCREVFA